MWIGKPSKRQAEILQFITKFQSEKNYSPSLGEIAEHFEVSIPTIHQHISYLRKKKLLVATEKGKKRSIQTSNDQKRDLIEIPLMGFIAAGQPIEAIEIPDETITLTRGEIGKQGKHYALRVQGSSMIDEGIFDGDVVVIREQHTANDGQTVVAIIDDNQATLKKLYREKGRFRLQPANQTLLPFYRTEVEVRGVVVKIIRDLEPVQGSDSELIKIIKKMPPTTNVRRVANSEPNEKPRPFIQWVGGKREMISQYQEFLPKKFKKYYEPFLGGGAMFFHLQPENAILSDNNKELIKAYEGVRDNPEEIIKLLKELRSKHSLELYTKIRNLDREINIFESLNSAEIGARMIYLNQTCFNGLYRVNQKSQFNVPIGSSLNRLICDENTIRSVSKVLKKITIQESDFETSVRKAQSGDFIYLDPPYYPISAYSDFTRYTKEKFYQEDQVRLKKEIDRLSKIGCKVMVSNSDCDFIKDLYKGYKLHKVYSGRTLNCKKDQRGKVSELFITNY